MPWSPWGTLSFSIPVLSKLEAVRTSRLSDFWSINGWKCQKTEKLTKKSILMRVALNVPKIRNQNNKMIFLLFLILWWAPTWCALVLTRSSVENSNDRGNVPKYFWKNFRFFPENCIGGRKLDRRAIKEHGKSCRRTSRFLKWEKMRCLTHSGMFYIRLQSLWFMVHDSSSFPPI